jgi:hypothetical protein
MIIINNPTQRRTFTQFRISCHKLQIEMGRYHKILQEERICEYCYLIQCFYILYVLYIILGYMLSVIC